MFLETLMDHTGHDLPGYITPDNRVRVLGCLPSPDKKFMTRLQDAVPILDEKDYVEFQDDPDVIPILDQGQRGSCVGHGGATSQMFARYRAGQPFIHLSPCYLYGLINGGRDQGANISDSAVALSKYGIALESQVPEGQIYRRQISDVATVDATAKRFLLLKYYSIESWEELCTAVQLRWPVSFSVCVKGDWTNLDKNDCPEAWPGFGNHCTATGYGMRKLSGEWMPRARNSWSTQWGNNGRFNFRKAHIEREGGFDAFAIQSVEVDPEYLKTLPIAS